MLATGSSLIGTMSSGESNASASIRVVSVSVLPSSSNPVRVTCTALSRSPRSMNSATPEKRRQRAIVRPAVWRSSERYRGPAERSADSARRWSSSCVAVVSSAIPHHVSRFRTPPCWNNTVSISGQTRRPPSSTSSPVLPTTVVSAGEKTSSVPSNSLGVPVPPERNVTMVSIPSRKDIKPRPPVFIR